MIKVIAVFGTRPEAIKMAPVIHQLKMQKSKFKTVVCVTAQHRQMLDQVLKIFRLKCDYDLNIMQKAQSLYQITTNGLLKLEEIFKKEKPHIVLVHGDTTTTLVAALAAFYEKIPVGHVEAGLRSFDKFNPFPEEINRRIADVLADLYFAPTPLSARNLKREGILDKNIYVTGNTVIDALLMALKAPYQAKSRQLKSLAAGKKIILVTVHRRENWGTPLKNICTALAQIADRYPDVQIIYPVHLNPQVKNVVYAGLTGRANILLCEPLDYLDFVHVMKRSYMVVTDSGGLQEEAPSLGKPVLVLRQVTERPEAVKAGTVRVIGTATKAIYQEISRLLSSKPAYQKMANAVNPYGDGRASERIAKAILQYFHNK
ncbi:MAG: UDP-N-acetylglucosamine 2-epimerase (non-hydrolyzing) [bacterium]|nr:UDP-N-acetylglucosamine 2-epimerase (non-hydrolyzing) [bacterium]MDD5354346.1 UDP-N-acetylglucosamine 2-epimerase (non-hydrolyzing) [bacterium]MDD5755796.1 UDP-N-acetylglucosamine 2-epimerase (non-hydrolyzing) [bacterium]